MFLLGCKSSLDSLASTVECCVWIEELQRSFSVEVQFVFCSLQLEVSIENLKHSQSLVDFSFNVEHSLDLFGIFSIRLVLNLLVHKALDINCKLKLSILCRSGLILFRRKITILPFKVVIWQLKYFNYILVFKQISLPKLCLHFLSIHHHLCFSYSIVDLPGAMETSVSLKYKTCFELNACNTETVLLNDLRLTKPLCPSSQIAEGK